MRFASILGAASELVHDTPHLTQFTSLLRPSLEVLVHHHVDEALLKWWLACGVWDESDERPMGAEDRSRPYTLCVRVEERCEEKRGGEQLYLEQWN